MLIPCKEVFTPLIFFFKTYAIFVRMMNKVCNWKAYLNQKNWPVWTPPVGLPESSNVVPPVILKSTPDQASDWRSLAIGRWFPGSKPPSRHTGTSTTSTTRCLIHWKLSSNHLAQVLWNLPQAHCEALQSTNLVTHPNSKRWGWPRQKSKTMNRENQCPATQAHNKLRILRVQKKCFHSVC